MKTFSLSHRLADSGLRQLRAVAAVAGAGTLSGAAKRLHVTPPAVAQQLKLATEAAGLPLFERIDRKMVATEAGRIVLAAGVRVESALADSAAELLALRDGLAGRVSVGVISTAKYFMPHVLAAFRDLHPDIQLDIEVGNRGDIVEALEHYAYDVAVMGRPPQGLDLVTELIGEHPHVIIAPPGHPRAGDQVFSIAELASELFLVRETGSGTRSLNEHLFEEAGMGQVSRMQIGSNETIKQGVMAGLGVAFISGHTIAAEVAEGRLCVLPVRGLPVQRAWFIVRRADKRLFPAGELLWDFVEAEAAASMPEL